MRFGFSELAGSRAWVTGLGASALQGTLGREPQNKKSEKYRWATWQQVQSLRPLVALPQSCSGRLAFQDLGLALVVLLP